MALTDELIQEVIAAAVDARCSNTQFARAIESAACAERDARIAELERQLAEARNQALEEAAELCDRLQEVPATEARHCAADIRSMKEQT